jgi:hypothetical protein
MISVKDYLMGRDDLYPEEFSSQIEINAHDTVHRVNELAELAGWTNLKVNSGWRPSAVNDATSNAAKKSNHLLAKACDLADPDGSLDAWCMANLDKLEEVGLWMEHPDKTKGWCHLQTCPPKSGKRVFMP